MRPYFVLGVSCAALRAWAAPPTQEEFTQSIRPVLQEHCASCHNPANPKNRVDFLKAATATDIEAQRGLWRNVAAQLRNRTMPPVASKITEQERLRVASWIDSRLRQTACSAGDYAGAVTVRRLNRREYRNTIRDLLGVDFAVNEIFPADGTGGEGFDTNGETLFLPPILMERYVEAADQVLARVIVTPGLNRNFPGFDMEPKDPKRPPKRLLQPGEKVSQTVNVYAEGDYDFRVSIERPTKSDIEIGIQLDGRGSVLPMQRYDAPGTAARSKSFRLSRGVHTIGVEARGVPIELFTASLDQRAREVAAEKKALHYRLFHLEPGEAPAAPRRAAQRLLADFLRKAFRRPVGDSEVEKYLKLYDRAAERGDPYEEGVRLALKAVLISPDFLFRIEEAPGQPGIQPLRDHELAARLSYFLWSTTPDDELLRLAGQGGLRDAKTLAEQVDRMIDDPRSRVFANTFIGQWLGTEDVGGRVAPTVSEVQHFYTPEVAADLREEPVLLFHHILGENRSLLDLLNGNYSFLTERLAKFYEIDDKVGGLQNSVFRRVEWPDDRRAGVLGLGAVLALTSNFKQTSPVLRGSWVLGTLLGTSVPPPPGDVPPLDASAKKNVKETVRQKLVRHRADPTCAACHNLMDPIGFGLENFDWLGRWRDQDNGHPVDAAGETPSGEKFTGPVELRAVLLRHKDEFIRNVTSKALGYALGRSLGDGDHCTVQRIADKLEQDGYRARTLIREVASSVPFRNSQRDAAPVERFAPVKKRPRPPIDK